eukprot:m.75334 g.75334  ORF g.75334 m.75334 type:complete len:312 (-) comp50385_c0_seq1:65-1000(-)
MRKATISRWISKRGHEGVVVFIAPVGAWEIEELVLERLFLLRRVVAAGLLEKERRGGIARARHLDRRRVRRDVQGIIVREADAHLLQSGNYLLQDDLLLLLLHQQRSVLRLQRSKLVFKARGSELQLLKISLHSGAWLRLCNSSLGRLSKGNKLGVIGFHARAPNGRQGGGLALDAVQKVGASANEVRVVEDFNYTCPNIALIFMPAGETIEVQLAHEGRIVIVLEEAWQHISCELLGVRDPEAEAVGRPLKAVVLPENLVRHLVQLRQEGRQHSRGGGHGGQGERRNGAAARMCGRRGGGLSGSAVRRCA